MAPDDWNTSGAGRCRRSRPEVASPLASAAVHVYPGRQRYQKISQQHRIPIAGMPATMPLWSSSFPIGKLERNQGGVQVAVGTFPWHGAKGGSPVRLKAAQSTAERQNIDRCRLRVIVCMLGYGCALTALACTHQQGARFQLPRLSSARARFLWFLVTGHSLRGHTVPNLHAYGSAHSRDSFRNTTTNEPSNPSRILSEPTRCN